MKWEHETWRKLYTRVTAQWAALPALARGLGTELLKYCSDSGRLTLSPNETPAQAIVRLLAAHPSERRQIQNIVALLITDGFLYEDGNCLVIKNFEDAQARSTSAERTRRWREKQRHGDASPYSHDGRHGDCSLVTVPRSEIDQIPLTPAERGDLSSGQENRRRRTDGTSLRAVGANPRALAAQAARPAGIAEPGSIADVAAPSPPPWAGTGGAT